LPLAKYEIGISVATIDEFVHGAYRAKTQAQKQQQLESFERLSVDVR